MATSARPCAPSCIAARGVALETLHAGALDPILGELAHHWFEAAPLGTLPRAIECATLAGHRAFAQLGYEEAAGHFERALQASRGGAVDATTRLQLLVVFGQAQQAAGDDEGARATLIEAAQLARDLGDATMFASAVALAGASGSETGTVDVTVIGLLEDAIREAGPGDSRRRAFLLAQLSRSLYFADAERRLECSAEALAVARRLHDELVLLTALQARHFALWEPGTVAERRTIGAEELALAEGVGHPLGIAEEYAWRILDHPSSAIPDVEETMRRYRDLAARGRLPRVRWHASLVETAPRSWPGASRRRSGASHRPAPPAERRNNRPVLRRAALPSLRGARSARGDPAHGRPGGRARDEPADLARGAGAALRDARRDGRRAKIARTARGTRLRGLAARRQSHGHVGAPRGGLRAPRRAALGGMLLPMVAAHTDGVIVIATTVTLARRRYAGLPPARPAGWTRRSPTSRRGSR